jgi:hypothetical protein
MRKYWIWIIFWIHSTSSDEITRNQLSRMEDTHEVGNVRTFYVESRSLNSPGMPAGNEAVTGRNISRMKLHSPIFFHSRTDHRNSLSRERVRNR